MRDSLCQSWSLAQTLIRRKCSDTLNVDEEMNTRSRSDLPSKIILGLISHEGVDQDQLSSLKSCEEGGT